MTTEPTPLARTIALIAAQYPNRPALAFNPQGHLVDWQEIDSDGWVHNADPDDRHYIVVGGTNPDATQQVINATDNQ
ncbi:hypothetical protein [Williamsia serinedens]|uniref:Uncharacterized protein n=1 Tax=Williamsia serinedens TaxID=391736 RepID=A0ABT1H6Z7_9NOCA|nr:hypothetical protein [Williamsia serinedens]MCP2163025.1 hypothetical protein [Williamsia serinedens]